MFQRTLYGAVILWAFIAVAHYDGYVTQLKNGATREAVLPEKIAAGVMSAMWPMQTNVKEYADQFGFDAPEIDWKYLIWGYVGLSYIGSIRYLKTMFSQDRWESYYRQSSMDLNDPPILISAGWVLSPISLPLMYVYNYVAPPTK